MDDEWAGGLSGRVDDNWGSTRLNWKQLWVNGQGTSAGKSCAVIVGRLRGNIGGELTWWTDGLWELPARLHVDFFEIEWTDRRPLHGYVMYDFY